MSGRKTTRIAISDDELRSLRNKVAQATSLQQGTRLLNQFSARNEAALAEYRFRISMMNNNMDGVNRRLTGQGVAVIREAQTLHTWLQQTVRDSNIKLQEMLGRNEERVRELHQNFISELSKTRSELSVALEQTEENAANAVSNNRRIEAAMRQNSQQLEGGNE